MALIPILHVLAPSYPVDPNTNPNLLEGKVVKMVGGFIVAAGADEAYPLGIAGDSSTKTSAGLAGTPYSKALIINSAGATRATQNRVSDFFDETLASGKVTVYQNGGSFASDQVDATLISANPATGSALGVAANGLLKVYNAGAVVGIVTRVYGAEASGVPGVDVDGSISLGNFIEFKLSL